MILDDQDMTLLTVISDSSDTALDVGRDTDISADPTRPVLEPAAAETRPADTGRSPLVIVLSVMAAAVIASFAQLSTPRRGCSGLAYSVDYVTEEVAMDEKIQTPGGTFYIDGASVLYLVGSIMDWVVDDFTAGFTFENPNAKGACGCGESFMV